MNWGTVIQAQSAFFQVVIPLVVQLIGLTIAVCIDDYLGKRQRRIMLAVTATVLLLIFQNYVEYRLVTGTPHIRLRTWVAIGGYCIRPLILMLFFPIVHPTGRNRLNWVLLAVNAAVHLTALFSPICFRITPDNTYEGGPLRSFCLLISLVLLGQLLYFTLAKYSKKGKRKVWLPLFSVAMILVGYTMDSFSYKDDQLVEYLTIAVVISCVCYYIWLHLQFVLEHEQALRAEQRIQIMMSQIQPHFLNNTLSTIQALCRIDPEKAFDITAKFGTYLRNNLESLTRSSMIPIAKEMEHTKVYTDIETIRFPNITVTYDLQDDDFLLPPLSIQPLVENAIRHGVRIRSQGQVTVRTRRVRGAHQIQIIDNGKGFDPTTAAGGGMHIGLQNVRQRIEQMCGGTVMVKSEIGKGTTVILLIPGKDEQEA